MYHLEMHQEVKWVGVRGRDDHRRMSGANGQNDVRNVPWLVEYQSGQIRTQFWQNHLQKLVDLTKMSTGWKYESGQNDPKTLPQIGKRLEMPTPKLVCGNDLQMLADQAQNVSWQVGFRAYFQALNKSFRVLHIGRAFWE